MSNYTILNHLELVRNLNKLSIFKVYSNLNYFIYYPIYHNDIPTFFNAFLYKLLTLGLDIPSISAISKFFMPS